MLKIENDKCVVEGNVRDILVELMTLIKGVYEALINLGIPAEGLKQMITQCVRTAFMTPEEARADVKKIISDMSAEDLKNKLAEENDEDFKKVVEELSGELAEEANDNNRIIADFMKAARKGRN